MYPAPAEAGAAEYRIKSGMTEGRDRHSFVLRHPRPPSGSAALALASPTYSQGEVDFGLASQKPLHFWNESRQPPEGRIEAQGGDLCGLVERLATIGVDEKEVNVRNKRSRGKFTAAFLLQCLEAIGSRELRLD